MHIKRLFPQWLKKSHSGEEEEYFFYKNSSMHKILTRIHLGICLFFAVILVSGLIGDVKENDYFTEIVFNLTIAMGVGFYISYVFYKSITFPEKKAKDKAALNALACFIKAYQRLTFMIEEANNVCTGRNVLRIRKGCLKQDCYFNESGVCTSKNRILLLTSAIHNYLQSGLIIAANVKPSMVPIFEVALADHILIIHMIESGNNIYFKSLRGITSVHFYLSGAMTDDSICKSPFSLFEDRQALAKKYLEIFHKEEEIYSIIKQEGKEDMKQLNLRVKNSDK